MKRDEIPGMILKIRQLWSPRLGICVMLNNGKGDTIYRICCGAMSNPYLMAERCNIWDSSGRLLYQGELADSMMKGISLRQIKALVYSTVERQEPLKREKC